MTASVSYTFLTMPDNRTPDRSPDRPCVGRTLEIAAMRSQFDLALQGKSSFCYIKGEAGSGKSTLLRAFVSSLDKTDVPVVIAWGHCDQQTGSISPLSPWTQILQSLSGMSDIVIPEEQLQDRSNVVQTMRSAFTELAPDIIELLIPGFGLAVRSARLLKRSSLGERLTSSYARPEEIVVAADRSLLQDQYAAIIERVLDKAPLIIVMDDLDCCDEASLQLLSRIAERTQGRRLLFLAAMRDHPGDIALEPVIAQISKNVDTTSIDLDVARELRGSNLVAEYVEKNIPGVGEKFIRDLARHTGGHPLFVVELVEHFCKEGAIVQQGGRWQEDQNLSWRHVPKQIENVLSAQLASLDLELLDVLQAGSVEGDQFSIEVVAAALEKSPLSIARVLTRRAPKNLVGRLGTQILGRERVTLFRFCHSLARQHVYSGIEPTERVYLHGAVATQMEALAGDKADSIAAQLAYQFERARIEGKACGYYETAASFAISTCSLEEATTHLERALGLCTPGLAEMRIRHHLAKLKVMTGHIQDGAMLYAQARVIAEEEDSEALITILADQAFAAARLNDFDSAEAIAADAERLAREVGEESGLLSALETLASIHSKRGHHEEALAYQAEAMALAERLGNDSLLAGSLTKYGWYFKELGRYADAHLALQRSLAVQNRSVPNYSQLASTHNALADMYISQENYLEARKNMQLAVDCWQRFDRSADVAIGLSNLANLANREGLFEEALDYAREAYQEDLKVVGGDHPDLAFSLTCIGESLIGMQQFDAAITSLETAYNLRTKHGAPKGNTAWTGWLLGQALVDSKSNVGAGMQYVDDARTVLLSLGSAAQSELGDIDSWLSSHPESGGL